MPILVHGMSHRSAPLRVRERVAFLVDEIPGAVTRLLAVPEIQEGIILSTCNRTEIVVSAVPGSSGEVLARFLAAEKKVTLEELRPHCYTHADVEAVRHVFRATASLDSMVVGEAQILGQVKQAYDAAAEAGGVGTILEGLLQRAFRVAKRIRTETGIGRAPVSVAHVAADLAREIFGDLRDHSVLILGAGKMSRLAAQHLISGGVGSVAVASRSFTRAMALAESLAGRAVSFERMLEEVQRADIVITSTSSPAPILDHEAVQRISRARRGRPLFLIDIAVPRDVDPAVNTLDGVYLYDIDDLQAVARANLDGRRRESEAAEVIVEGETEEFAAWRRTLDVSPTIVALRRHVEDLGRAELNRHQAVLDGLGPEQRRLLDAIVTGLTNKFLHAPTVALKRAARSGAGPRVRLLREIFGLDGLSESGTDATRTAADATPRSVEEGAAHDATTRKRDAASVRDVVAAGAPPRRDG